MKRTRTYGLYRMGLYETYRFVILGDKTIFIIAKALAQVTKWDQ